MGGHALPAGAHETTTRSGAVVRTRADGRPADIHDARRGIDIHNNLGGGHRMYVDRPGGGRMYYERGRAGFIGHPYRAHGYDFNRRTYYWHGRPYDRYYRPYGYHGYMLDVYVPYHYYGVGFYGWAYNPWAVPVNYAWGWGPSPWYGYYGAYFTPYPVYATPSLWLTDYLISQQLAAAYAAQQAAAAGAAPAAYSGPPLSPQVKQLVAVEVQNDISLENAEATANAQQQVPEPAQSGVARLLEDGKQHVFVADKEVDVVQASNGQECAVSDGDVIQLARAPGPSDTTADVTVLSSKGGVECPASSTVAIGIDELQEMHNHLRETIDQGLEELQKKQGTGGLPAAPPSAKAPPVEALVAQGAPPPDPNGEKELEAQAQLSNTVEKDVTAEASVSSAPAPSGATTQTISLDIGQSVDQVKAAVGEPTKVVNMGPKSIYFYADMKVTLVNGKVTKIE
jgi:hypothetical protein